MSAAKHGMPFRPAPCSMLSDEFTRFEKLRDLPTTKHLATHRSFSNSLSIVLKARRGGTSRATLQNPTVLAS